MTDYYTATQLAEKTLRTNTGRSPDYRDGYDRALKDCVTWLHERAAKMNDPHAKQVLDSAAFSLGARKGNRDGEQHG